MLFREFQKLYTLDTGATANYGTKIENFRLQDRNWWLTNLDIIASVKLSAAVVTPTADSVLALLKNIRLEVNEGREGNRNVVNASGPAIVDLAAQQVGFIDRFTNYSFDRLGAANDYIGCVYPIAFRNPLVPAPISYSLALPLPRYGSDPLLSVEIGTAAECGGTFTTANAGRLGVKVQALATYAEVIDPNGSFPHWKQEISTPFNKYTWGATGQRSIEDILQGGLLLGLLQQDYLNSGARGFALQADATDAAEAVNTQTYTLEYRQRNVRQGTPMLLQSANDMSMARAASGSAFSAHAFTPSAGVYSPHASLYHDFLCDRTLTDTFSFRSGLDLSPQTLSGGKLKLIASSIGHAGNQTRLTYWRLVGDVDRFMSATV